MPAPTSRAGRKARRPQARRKRRFVEAPQMELELAPEGTLDQRIAWAKATAGNYEEWAAKEAEPAAKARLERRAAAWCRTVLDLIEERERRDRQLDLF